MNRPHEWRLLVVEDDPQMQKDLYEYFHGREIAGAPINVNITADFQEVLRTIGFREADLIVLDVFEGPSLARASGLDVLRAVQEAGFVGVVLYTAHPEKVEDFRNVFVRLVGKDVGSLDALLRQIEDLFTRGVPQLHRALSQHLQVTLRDYMWGFVQENWEDLSAISGSPEFVRVVLNRLAATLSREGIDGVIGEIFGEGAKEGIVTDCVHPAEVYIMPPIDPTYARLGDVRIRLSKDGPEYLIVVWPSCDLFKSVTRRPKTDRVLCVAASRLDNTDEFLKWRESKSGTARGKLAEMMKNRRSLAPDRYHYLPGLCNVPDLVVDFQKVETIDLDELCGMACPATIASPFAESIEARFLHYIGRLGTPDLDIQFLINRLG